jgi:hypothetical protein
MPDMAQSGPSLGQISVHHRIEFASPTRARLIGLTADTNAKNS